MKILRSFLNVVCIYFVLYYCTIGLEPFEKMKLAVLPFRNPVVTVVHRNWYEQVEHNTDWYEQVEHNTDWYEQVQHNTDWYD